MIRLCRQRGCGYTGPPRIHNDLILRGDWNVRNLMGDQSDTIVYARAWPADTAWLVNKFDRAL